MGKSITQLAAFVDGARSLRCHVTGDAARKGELLEQALHAFLIR